MVQAWLAPDPDAKSLRAEILEKDVGDALAYAITHGPFTSVEVRRDAALEDLAQGNGKVVGHRGASSPEYYKRWDNPEWAVIFDTDCPFDPRRGRELLKNAGYITTDGDSPD